MRTLAIVAAVLGIVYVGYLALFFIPFPILFVGLVIGFGVAGWVKGGQNLEAENNYYRELEEENKRLKEEINKKENI